MRKLIAAALAAWAIASSAPAFAANSAPLKEVPCPVFGMAHHGACTDPVHEGIVDGQWIAVVVNYGGTDEGARSLIVYTVGMANGNMTIPLAPIAPSGNGGNHMSVRFAGGKLIVYNAIYRKDEALCCPAQMIVRRFGFDANAQKLHAESSATLPLTATDAQVDKALGITP